MLWKFWKNIWVKIVKKESNFRKFLPYYKPYVRFIMFDLLCAALSTVCELVFPMIVRYITGTALASPEKLIISSVLKIGGGYLILRIIDTLANYYMAYIGHITGTMLETDMRRDLFAHLQELPFSYFDNTKIGQIMSRVTNDLFDITEFSHHFPEEMFIAAIKIIGAFVILAGIDIRLTVLIFLLLPFMLVSVALFRKKMKDAFKKQRIEVGELNASLEDSLLGIRVVKSFANEELEKEKFEAGNMRFYEAKKHAYKYMARFQASTRFFDGVMYIAVIVIGSVFMINGYINSADLIAYLLYIQTLITSIRKIVEFTEQFQKGITGIERFSEIMYHPVEILDGDGAKDITGVKGNVRFENVTFGYSDDDGKVLKNISVDINAGESIAVVGPSGGGKTTLCNLIPRFYDISEGRITVDGTDIRDITLSSLRGNIGMVQQDVYLFSGSVKENIAYGRPGASDEEITEAARMAGADDFINELPQGYDTYVGERGVKLSGGQKQRISIARLFLKNPPILILDEATSALDNESELLVQKSLEKLAKGRTTFTIAHRLTTIRNASRIIVLTKDGIKESGTHSELIAKGGEYAKLYSLYTSLE